MQIQKFKEVGLKTNIRNRVYSGIKTNESRNVRQIENEFLFT